MPHYRKVHREGRAILPRVRMSFPAAIRRGTVQTSGLVRLLDQVDVPALVEETMTAKDRRYGGRTITLPKDVAERLEAFRKALEEEFGASISYHLAIAIALKRAQAK